MYGFVTYQGLDGREHQRSFDSPEALTAFVVELLDFKIKLTVTFCQ